MKDKYNLNKFKDDLAYLIILNNKYLNKFRYRVKIYYIARGYLYALYDYKMITWKTLFYTLNKLEDFKLYKG